MSGFLPTFNTKQRNRFTPFSQPLHSIFRKTANTSPLERSSRCQAITDTLDHLVDVPPFTDTVGTEHVTITPPSSALQTSRFPPTIRAR